MKKLFALMGGIILLSLSIFAQAGTASVRKYAVALRETIIYAEPNTNSEALFVVPQGERMLILEDQLAWLKVKTSSGIVGFVRASSVKVEIERIIRQATENPPGIKAQPPASPPSGAKTTISRKHSRLPFYIAGGLAVAGATAYVLFRKGGLLNRGTATLKVNSHPSQAKVYIDDEEKCETPCTVEKVSPGKHTIKVVRELYGEWTKEMELKGYQEYNIEATLSPYRYEPDFCFGSQGSGNGQLYSPWDLTVDNNGNIYVADTWNQRLQKFDSSGNFILKVDTPPPGSSPLDPTGVVFSPSNHRIYVVFEGDPALNWYSLNLNWISRHGLGLTRPRRLGVDSSGNIYIADSGNDRIIKTDAEGNEITEWSTGSGSWPIEAAPYDNNVYVALAGPGKVKIYSSSGSEKGEFPKKLLSPLGIAVDRMGHVYVTAAGEAKVYKFTPDGTEALSFGSYGSGRGNFNGPAGIEVLENGDVLIADIFNNRICKWRMTEETISTAEASITIKRKKAGSFHKGRKKFRAVGGTSLKNIKKRKSIRK